MDHILAMKKTQELEQRVQALEDKVGSPYELSKTLDRIEAEITELRQDLADLIRRWS